MLAHDEALTYGGRYGVSSLHLIESALARQYSGYHLPIAAKSAALLHSMVGNHGFTDGNKRTSWILVEILIERSGYYLNIDDDEPIDDLVVKVASNELNFDDLMAWFTPRLIRS